MSCSILSFLLPSLLASLISLSHSGVRGLSPRQQRTGTILLRGSYQDCQTEQGSKFLSSSSWLIPTHLWPLKLIWDVIESTHPPLLSSFPPVHFLSPPYLFFSPYPSPSSPSHLHSSPPPTECRICSGSVWDDNFRVSVINDSSSGSLRQCTGLHPTTQVSESASYPGHCTSRSENENKTLVWG